MSDTPATVPTTLSIPIPSEVAGTESTGTIPAYDDLPLYYTRYHPPTSVPTKAALVFLHGFMDHIGPYHEGLRLFAARGIEVLAFDQRGFGLTAVHRPGGIKKNYTDTTWSQQFKDVKTVLEAQRKWIDEKYGERKLKLFLMGHSMGGGITAALFTRAAESPDGKELANITSLVDGAILASPWITLTVPPARLLVAVLKLVSKILPNIKYYTPLQLSEITRDPEWQAKLEADEWMDGWVSVKSVQGPLDGGPHILTDGHAHFVNNEVPILAIHGEADKITDPAGSKKLIELLKQGGAKDAHWEGYPEAVHTLMIDSGDVPTKSTNFVIDWILARV